MFSLRKEINLMNTQKEKQNQLAKRRRTLLASQNVLSKEIDEVIKMIDPIGLDFEASEKEVA